MADGKKGLPPRRLELNSVTPHSNNTYDSGPAKRWPKSGTDSAKTPKTSTQTDSDLAKIIEVWDELPEHIKITIRTLVSVTDKQKRE
jgi:hypothetical protein